MSEQSTTVAQMIPLAQVEIAPNVRTKTGLDTASIKELSESLKAHGLMQPIYVAKAGDGRFMVIAGQRRTLAANMAGWTEIPAIVSENSTGEELKAKQVIENLHRENLSLSETCIAVRELLAMVGKPAEVARRLNKSAAWVSKHLAITGPAFSEEVRSAVAQGLCNDLETIHMLNQIAKHPNGKPKLEKLMAALVSDGITRGQAREALESLKGKAAAESEEGEGDQEDGEEQAPEKFGKLELAEKPAKLILQALSAAALAKPNKRKSEELAALMSHVSDFIEKTWPKEVELREDQAELPV